jgi:hypothetical protein
VFYDRLEEHLGQGRVPDAQQCREVLYVGARTTPVDWDELLQQGLFFGKEILGLFLDEWGIMAAWHMILAWSEGLATSEVEDCFPNARTLDRPAQAHRTPRPTRLLSFDRLPVMVYALVMTRSRNTDELLHHTSWQMVEDMDDEAIMTDAHVLLFDVSTGAADWIQTSRACEKAWCWLLKGKPAMMWGLANFQDVEAFKHLREWFVNEPVGNGLWFGNTLDAPSTQTA